MRPGTIVGKRFIIEREASSGGMGTVYCAFDRVTGEPVALKVLRSCDALDAERSTREAAILAGLDHPAIVGYVASGATVGGHPWLAMEWLDGEDLAQRLAREELLLSDAVGVARRAAEALAFAHARGLVHRDLKPSNLFLPDGDVARLKVLDFGIARVAGDPHRLTCTGVLLGTLGYVAPEQIQGACDADPRADVFALGCVLFECLASRPAFAGAHPMAVLAKILLDEPPSPGTLRPGVPDGLDALVRRMLAKDPRGRPRDAAEVRDALDALGPLDEPPEPAARSSRNTMPSLSGADPASSHGPASIGRRENRLVSVVLAGGVDRDEPAPTTTEGSARLAALDSVVARFGGQTTLRAGQSIVVTIWSNGDAVDRAERAAECALAIAERAPELPVCVVTGRGIAAARLVGGDLIDRGVAALRGTPRGAVRIDETTAAALGPRFVVHRDEAGGVLRDARAEHEAEPTLLGKPAPFVGRDREIAVLEGLFEGCAAEPMAGVALVVGPCGIGKSRLRHELGRRLERRIERATVLVGRGDAALESAPLGMIAGAIRHAAGIHDGEPLADRRRKLAERVGQRLGGAEGRWVTAFTGEIASTPFPDDFHEGLRNARRDPMLMGDSMCEAWCRFIAAECADRPVILVLEDLHWSDAPSIRLVDAALRDLSDLPFVVIALARPEVEARFPVLFGARDLQVIRLGPIPRRSSESLVRSALGEGTSDLVVTEIVERGGGNPFYLQELVRAVAAGRGDAFPASVLDAVEARLDAEGTEAKRVLRAASIFGRRFSRDGVAVLTGMGARHAGEWLERLEAHELVSSASSSALPGDVDFVFRHALVREAAYATLTEDDRALGHELAGTWLEQTGRTDAIAMAKHFRLGRQPWRAIPWYLAAASHALEASELKAALDHAEEALACGARGFELGRLRSIQAEAHLWRGEISLAASHGTEAITSLPRGSEEWFHAVTHVVRAEGRMGHLESVDVWTATVISTVPEPCAERARDDCLDACAKAEQSRIDLDLVS